MLASMSVLDNIAQVQKRLTDIERRQIPFATAGAINDTLFDIRKQIVGVTAPRAFDIRNKRFLSAAIRVKKASKRNLVGEVFDHLGRGHLGLHARGGTLMPRGRHLAIPGRDIENKRTAGGAIRKALRPRTVLSKSAKRRAFVTTFKSGQQAIVRRKGKKRQPLQVLYLLEPRARIRKTFPFHADAERVARAQFKRHFNRRLRQALRTAR